MINGVKQSFCKHQEWRRECINLVASENVMSSLARQALQSDMGQRYYFKDPYAQESGIKYSYRGTRYISEILTAGQKLAQEVFEGDYASLYPLSGHQANLGVLFAFCKQGDTFMCHDPFYGGYPGLDRKRLPKYLGLNVIYMPVKADIPEMIDIERTVSLIEQHHPKILILSSAHTLFPVPMEELSEACQKNDCVLVYDASHPLGLIAGKQFQNPIGEGADILVSGTQKSFPGPQGGIIITNKYSEKIQQVEQFVMVDNPHFNRIGALTISLLEMKHFGESYARQTVTNTQCLAKHLEQRGLPVRYKELDFTQSHMLKLDIFEGYHDFTGNLEAANIILDSSGRVGFNEMTRYGMKEPEIEQIAEFIERVFKGEEPDIIRNEVIDFRKSFQTVEYCFEDDSCFTEQL